MDPTAQPGPEHHNGAPTELEAARSPAMSPPPTYGAAQAIPQPHAEHYGMQYKSDTRPMPSPQMQQVHNGQPYQRQQHPAQYTPHPQQQYNIATPIPNLGMSSMPVDCPNCGQRSLTKVDYQSGNTTHAWALVLCCITGCLCFIPYLMTSMKDVQHRCGSCGCLLATWHKSGNVEVHAHP